MEDTALSPGSGKKLFFGLFIFPLMIAVGMAVLLCTVVLMTHEKQTPESLLVGLKKSAPSKRWQKAFELSNEINRSPGKMQEPAVYREMISILRDPAHFDPKTRSYMAIALSHNPTAESAAALERAVEDPDEEVRIHAMWSLGVSGRKESAPKIEPMLAHESAAIRKTAAYVLGSLESSASAPALERALNDPVEDVRWNAALALARLGNGKGAGVMISMLERKRLSGPLGLPEPQIEAAMINAMKGLALIRESDSIKILQTVSKSDPNLKVRQAAIETLQHLERA